MPKSTIWDAETGFGGNGRPNKTEYVPGEGEVNCVTDGPFSDLRPAYFGLSYEPHCLFRNWNNGTNQSGNMFGPNYSPAAVSKVLAQQTYPDFRLQLEGGPHGAIHSGVGGDMSPATSPNGEFLCIDVRIAYTLTVACATCRPHLLSPPHPSGPALVSLAAAGPAVRNTAFGGPKTQAVNSTQATLDDIMPFMGLAENIKVFEMMTTQSSRLCYVC